MTSPRTAASHPDHFGYSGISDELDIVDADIVPQYVSDDTVIQVHLRELPRDDEPLPAVQDWWAVRRAAFAAELERLREQIASDSAFARLQQEEIAAGGRFDWLDWLQSLLAAQGRRDVATYRDLIAMGERRGFFG